MNYVDQIERFLQQNVSETVYNRGLGIYSRKEFLLKEKDIIGDTYLFMFEFMGTKKYFLSIEIGDKTISTSCTCPFDDEPICKHRVAALLYLQDNVSLFDDNVFPLVDTTNILDKDDDTKDIDDAVKPTNSTKKTVKKEVEKKEPISKKIGGGDGWVNFGMLYKINFHDVYDTRHKKLLSIAENCDVSFEEINEEEFVFHVDYLGKAEHTVKFRREGSNVWGHCSSGPHSVKKSPYQIAVLIFLMRFKSTFFQIDAKYSYDLLQQEVQSIMEKNNFSLEEFYKYSRVKWTLDGNARIIPNNGYESLITRSAFENYGKVVDTNVFKKSDFGLISLKKSENRSSSKPVLFLIGIANRNDLHLTVSMIGEGEAKKNNPKLLKKPKLVPEESLSIREQIKADFWHLYQENTVSFFKNYRNSLIDNFTVDEIGYLLLEKNYNNLKKLLSPDSGVEHFYLGDYYNEYSHKVQGGRYINYSPLPFFQFLKVERNDELIDFTLWYKVGDQEYAHDDERVQSEGTFLISVNKSTLHLVASMDNLEIVNILPNSNKISLFEHQFSEFYNDILSKHISLDDLDISELDLEVKVTTMQAARQCIYISEMSNLILLKPVVYYENEEDFNPLEIHTASHISDDQLFVKERDKAWEEDFVKGISQLHPSFEQQSNQGFFSLTHHDFISNYWFLNAFDYFKEKEIEVFGMKELKNFNYATERPQIDTAISSGIDWFDVDVNITIGDESITLKDLKKRLVKGENYIKLGNGNLAVLPEEWMKKMERYLRAGEIQKDGSLKISKQRFNIIDELFDEKELSASIIEELSEKRKRLQSFEKIGKIKLPKGIKATLRDYQQEGFNWLCFLNEFQWGGILADDMGLGKTLQVITFMQHLIEKGTDYPILVVVPTSLLFNWDKEIQKFCPSMQYAVFHGSSRKNINKLYEDNQVIITSYGIMTNALQELKELTFEYVILDESQAIKNPSSQRYKAARLLKAKNKLAMTGTPIENNTFDLYAQMNFSNPGLLGTTEHFRSEYSTPIDKDSNKEVAKELHKMTNPFILRRTKEKVAKELPDKTEAVIYCEMGKKQRKVYDAYRNEIRNKIKDKIEEDGLNQSKMMILQALTKLRQICDSPAILSDDEEYDPESVKLDELLSHLKEKTGQHKVLVFSQFVKMLGLIKSKLEEEGIKFEYLDGQSSTKQREQSVNNFQRKKSIKVFLISLKAGGTGLNLTKAEYVYLVDPWWNPAVENQAIDRCYRIGQKNKVFAYRMICRDTVEEKIMKYKSKKEQVADSIISVDESIMKSLSQDDVKDLFA